VTRFFTLAIGCSIVGGGLYLANMDWPLAIILFGACLVSAAMRRR